MLISPAIALPYFHRSCFPEVGCYLTSSRHRSELSLVIAGQSAFETPIAAVGPYFFLLDVLGQPSHEYCQATETFW
jgi:hypothetical protein